MVGIKVAKFNDNLKKVQFDLKYWSYITITSAMYSTCDAVSGYIVFQFSLQNGKRKYNESTHTQCNSIVISSQIDDKSCWSV